jgi:hypothetical protein
MAPPLTRRAPRRVTVRSFGLRGRFLLFMAL